jgi:hypothetical protein
MGGVGSGRRGGRPTVEGCVSFRLGIQDLRPMLRPPGGTAWVQCWCGDECLIVVLDVLPDCTQLRLRHPSRVSDDAERMEYTVDLTWTAPPRGPRPPWFLCSLSGRRCTVLYLPRGASKFASAKGHGMDYAVTRMTKLNQVWRHEAEERLDALANARLGGFLARLAVSRNQAPLAGLLRETGAGAGTAPTRPRGRQKTTPAADTLCGGSRAWPHFIAHWRALRAQLRAKPVIKPAHGVV